MLECIALLLDCLAIFGRLVFDGLRAASHSVDRSRLWGGRHRLRTCRDMCLTHCGRDLGASRVPFDGCCRRPRVFRDGLSACRGRVLGYSDRVRVYRGSLQVSRLLLCAARPCLRASRYSMGVSR